MNLALTNYGLRFIVQLASRFALQTLVQDEEACLLLDVLTGVLQPIPQAGPERQIAQHLAEDGLLELVPDTVSKADIATRYQRNPLRHVQRVIFEYTTCCNFNCQHCYNGPVKSHTEQNIDRLKSVVNAFAQIGVARFDFIGGEVSKYGDGWLDLARYMSQKGDITIALFTNGWWLDQTNFSAAGRLYPDVSTYLTDLQAHGVTHIVFSLDGWGEAHDQSRRATGLYNRILHGIEQVEACGLLPRVSVLIRDENAELGAWLVDLAERLYDFPPGASPAEKAQRLIEDRTNTLTSFIDIGTGATQKGTSIHLDQVPEALLRCKGFFRPAPSLTIKANGEVATCRITTAGEGYGNIHQRDIIQILNHLQDCLVFRLHAERRLAAYLPMLDRQIFGETFTHLCSLRAILTLIGRQVEQEGINPGDEAAIRRINQEVAAWTGHARSQMER